MKYFLILNIEDIPTICEHAINLDINDLRKNNDGTKCIFKVRCYPTVCEHLSSQTLYTHEEILEILKGEEWNVA
jgi:hypothetical protein